MFCGIKSKPTVDSIATPRDASTQHYQASWFEARAVGPLAVSVGFKRQSSQLCQAVEEELSAAIEVGIRPRGIRRQMTATGFNDMGCLQR